MPLPIPSFPPAGQTGYDAQLNKTISDLYAAIPLWEADDTGFFTLPRSGTNDSDSYGQTPGSGVVHITRFRALRDLLCGNVYFGGGGKAAVNSTHAWVGLAQDNGDGTLTTLARSADLTTLISGTYGTRTVPLTSAVQLTRGKLYAVTVLQIADTPASLKGQWLNESYGSSSPRMASSKGAQTAIPDTLSGLGDHAFPLYYELRP